MTAYFKRMPVGFSGSISRAFDITTEGVFLDANNLPAGFGVACKFAGDKLVPLSASDTVDKIVGFLVRPYPTNTYEELAYLVGKNKHFTADLLKRGYMTVKVANASTVTRNAPVYIRTANPTADSPLGAVVTTATDSVKLTNACFTGAGDESGNVEIAYNI